MMDIAEVVRLEPRVGDILAQGRRMRGVYASWRDYSALKREADYVVGWGRPFALGYPELRTSDAWDAVIRAIPEALGL